MFEIRVYIESEKILITQPYTMNDQPDKIKVSPEQVDALIEWLKEAKAEIEGKTIS